MPDDRFIHPKLGHNDRVRQLSWFERCVWLTYLLAADDFGIMRCSAVTIREADDRIAEEPESKVQAALSRIAAVGLVQTFTDRGRLYCFHEEWQNYQRIRRPRATLHPLPPPAQIATCTPATQKLFAQHALFRGGFFPEPLEDSGNVADIPPQDSGNVSTERPPAVSREPLAVSRLPLAVSREPPSANGTPAKFPDHPTRAQLRAMGTLTAPVVDQHVYRRGAVDVTHKTHETLRRKAALRLRTEGTAALDAFLADFYDQTEQQWAAAGGAPPGEAWRVWLAAWDAAYAVEARPSATTAKTAGNLGVVQRFIDRGHTG